MEDDISTPLLLMPALFLYSSGCLLLLLSDAMYEPKSAAELPFRSDDCDDGMKDADDVVMLTLRNDDTESVRTVDGVTVAVVATDADAVTDDGNDVGTGEPVSLAARPRFLLANSYISPNMPANVLRRFFIVSSASSATEVCDCVGWRCTLPEAAVPDCGCRDADEIVDDCDACESRRPTPVRLGLRCCSANVSAVVSELTLHRLP